jgi:diguanylate cyclase (GGDEF)-like protein
VLALWLLSYLAAVVAAEQRRTRDAALRLSLHDPLTHLYNRTFLFAVIEREIARAQRTSRRFSLLMLDLDGLKPINDRYGHYFGDRMLQAVAEAVRQGIRVIDSPARYGGDEFVILLPETDTDGAAVVAEKLRRSVAAIRLNAGTELLSTTASIGVVSFPDDGVSADALTNRADQVMYVAKRAGRNRVSVDGLAVVPGTASSSPAIPSKAAAARRLAKPPAPPVRPAPPRIPLPAAASGRPPASNLALRPTRTATSRAAVEPLPSLFADRIPSLDRPWSVRAGGTPAEPVGASGGPLRVPGSSPLRTTAPPSTRMRRFRLERHLEWIEDRTFERTMRRFFGDATDETASG